MGLNKQRVKFSKAVEKNLHHIISEGLKERLFVLQEQLAAQIAERRSRINYSYSPNNLPLGPQQYHNPPSNNNINFFLNRPCRTNHKLKPIKPFNVFKHSRMFLCYYYKGRLIYIIIHCISISMLLIAIN